MLRWTAYAILAGLAAVAVLVQLDQQSRSDAVFAPAVPEPVSANASRVNSRALLLAGDAEGALSQARTHLHLRPLPAESLTTLALAAAANEDEATLIAALEAASTRGWREPVAQMASGQSALETGEYDIAAQRIIALLSTNELREQAYFLLGQLIESPEGREAFAGRLGTFGRWQAGLLRPGALESLDLQNWAQTIAMAQAKGAQLPCDRLAILAENYERAGEVEAANLFWNEDCQSD